MTFVLDASVALGWCLDEEQTTSSRPVLDRLEREAAVVPAVWPLEVSNALAMAERQRRIDDGKITRFLAALRQLPIEVDVEGGREALTRVLPLARAHGLSAYDASYLELALRLGLSIATFDGELRDAAGRAGVAVLPLP